MKLSGQTSVRLLSLLDQILFSVANFLLTILIARHYSDSELAAYGIGLSLGLIIQGVQRNSYVVQNAVLLPGIVRRRATKVIGEQFFIWSILLVIETLIIAVLGFTMPGSYIFNIALSTMVCSVIYAQLDFDRILLVKHERYKDPLILSAIFFVLIGVLFFQIPAMAIPFWAFLLAILGYAALKVLWLVLAIGMPDFFMGYRLARRDLKKYFTGAMTGVIAYSGYNHFPLFILGALAAPIQSAAFVAMRGLMQPLNIITRSLDVIDKNLFQTEAGNTKEGMRRVFLRQSMIYLLLAASAIIALALLAPFIIQLAYGEDYVGFDIILVGWGFIFSMLALTFPAETVIVGLDRLNTYNKLRLIAGIIATILTFVLAPAQGALGTVIACFFGWVIAYASALWLIRDVLFISKEKQTV